MMMGSVEQEIKDVSEVPTDLPTVINDFDEVIIRFFFSKYFLFLYVCTYAFMYFVKSKFVLIISCQEKIAMRHPVVEIVPREHP